MANAIGNLSTMQSPAEMAQTSREVSFYNKSLNNGKELKKILNQEDFLNLLITQLKNQDPTDPMKDKESIAQMAAFSSLEQMTNMAKNMDGVAKLMTKSQAYSLLGKNVEIGEGAGSVQGVVDEVTGGDAPQVLINGQYYDFGDIRRVTNAASAAAATVASEEKGE
jgi:flagellar basal-body rod modification protein FlgD